MSGIVAIWNRDGAPLDERLLLAITARMKHRGPDGAGHWISGPVGMGHQMLRATPESATEQQPLSDVSGQLRLVFDGRIDNRPELTSSLISDCSESHATDAELVMAGYRCDDERIVPKLIGDFAFAIWDARKHMMFCARDALGLRPLYYACVGQTFICASEIQSLLLVPNLRCQPNLPILAAYVSRKNLEYDETTYAGIYRLPPGHCMSVTPDSIEVQRYWNPDPQREIRYRNDDEYGEHFREVFEASVRSRLRTDAPVAAWLSGGLDSSSIVCMASRILKEKSSTALRMETFSLVFDEVRVCDERQFINAVIGHCGAKANFHVADQDLKQVAMEHHALFPDVPYRVGNLAMAPMLADMKSFGFRVLLDGTGGDELCGPGITHRESHARDLLWKDLRALLKRSDRSGSGARWRTVARALTPMIPGSVRRPLRLLAAPFRQKPMPSVATPEILNRTGASDRIAHVYPTPNFPSEAHREMYQTMMYGWGPIAATDGAELFVARFGIELREPMRDRRLVEFAFALPEEQLWREGVSRVALRNAMKGILPEEIRTRRSKGAFLPFYDVALHSQAREIKALFAKSVLVELGVADPINLKALIESYLSSRDMALTMRVSDLITVELIARDILSAGSLLPRRGEGASAI